MLTGATQRTLTTRQLRKNPHPLPIMDLLETLYTQARCFPPPYAKGSSSSSAVLVPCSQPSKLLTSLQSTNSFSCSPPYQAPGCPSFSSMPALSPRHPFHSSSPQATSEPRLPRVQLHPGPLGRPAHDTTVPDPLAGYGPQRDSLLDTELIRGELRPQATHILCDPRSITPSSQASEKAKTTPHQWSPASPSLR